MNEEISFFIILLGITYYGFINYKKKLYIKEALFFISFIIVNSIITILHVIDVSVPTPLDLLTLIYKPIGDLLYNLFG